MSPTTAHWYQPDCPAASMDAHRRTRRMREARTKRTITIGQLARYAGVTIKAVRYYHRRGLPEEPPRDSSGYRRVAGESIAKSLPTGPDSRHMCHRESGRYRCNWEHLLVSKHPMFPR